MYNEFKDLDVDIELNFFMHLGFRDATTRKRMNEVTSPNAITENRIATVKLNDFNTAIRLLRMSCKNEELDGHPWQMVSDEDVLDAIADRDQFDGNDDVRKAINLAIIMYGIDCWQSHGMGNSDDDDNVHDPTESKWLRACVAYRASVPVLPQWQDTGMGGLSKEIGTLTAMMLPLT